MINIVTNNHSSALHIQDFLEYLYVSCNAAGIKASYGTGEWLLDSPNIFLEGGDLTFNKKIVNAKKIYPQLKTYAIVSEFIQDGIFNSANSNWKNPNTTNHYNDNSYWTKRTEGFFELLPHLDGLICMDSIVYEQYKSIHNKCFYLPLMFSKELNKTKDDAKFYDAVFSGTLTEHRVSIINKLRNLGFKIALLEGATPEYIRNAIYSQSKIALGLKLSEETLTFSSMRAFYCLNNEIPHLFENVNNKSDLYGFVNFAAGDDLIQSFVDLLNEYPKIKFQFKDYRKFTDSIKQKKLSEFKKWLLS